MATPRKKVTPTEPDARQEDAQAALAQALAPVGWEPDANLPVTVTTQPGDGDKEYAAVMVGDVAVNVYESLLTPGKVVVDVLTEDDSTAPLEVTVNDQTVFERRPAIVLPRGTRHLLETDVRREVHDHYGEDGYRLTDAAAVAIASWFQSPTGTGLTFAEFVSHQPVTPDALAEAAQVEIQILSTSRATWLTRALKMLVQYARTA